MVRTSKTAIVVLIVSIVAAVALAPAIADESGKSFNEAVKSGAKATVNYPANLLNQSVETVGTAASNTAGVVVDTVKVTGETLTGDVKKAPEIVITPVKKSAETIRDAVVDTAETPVKAAQKTVEQDQ
ncbi:MAG: hypothetical protein KAS86_02815 [Candidatus Omnitrophica bacterium]|nr:hypothetical protein [Candidatus Omnitrophota bacterium]